MGQSEKERKLRSDVDTLRQVRAGRRLFDVEARRLKELEKDLAKIDERKAKK